MREEKGSAPGVVDEPEKKGENNAHDETGDNRKVERRVYTTMNNVAGKASQTEWQFATKKEKRADEDERSSEDEKSAAEVAKVHEESLGGVTVLVKMNSFARKDEWAQADCLC